jgi:hypothetical protein
VSFRFSTLAAAGLALLIVAGAAARRASTTNADGGQEGPGGGVPVSELTGAAATAADAVVGLQQKIDSGAVKLTFDEDFGYLRSLLENLNIHESSQTLVFSKSSAQMSGISPERPRAIYFNDDVYVGWVQEGALELAAIDPKEGPFFYTLPQIEEAQPKFERHTSSCVGCHDSSDDPSRLIPRLLKLSVLADRTGLAIQAAALATTDRSPFRERWGGWYVTGTHGRQRHMGNLTFPPPGRELTNLSDYVVNLDLDRGANVTDLTGYFDTKRYLTPHSDIVALMVLGHQTHVFNLMSAAIYRLRTIPEDDPAADMEAVVKQLGEPIVRAMLFSGEARLTDRVAGTTAFAAEFQKQGPRDRLGRSLRDLDLETRLRFREVLSGEDTTTAFAHLSAADRDAIRSILADTKPDFARLLENGR